MRVFFYLSLLVIFNSCGNTFYVVRHAEKERPLAGMSLQNANDPGLTDSGNLRALALKERLQGEGIKHIFSSGLKRTNATAKPLDEYLLDVQTQVYNPNVDSLNALIQKLKAIRKGNVLIVGHSNTIDDIANLLCGSTVVAGDLKDTDYDNLYKIKRRGDKFTFKGEVYGAPTQ